MFRLIKSIRKYWVPSILTIVFMVGEAALETLIPYITANLVNSLSEGNVDMAYLLRIGGLLSAIALVSLACGGMGGFTASMASTGFAKNIRGDLMRKIQTFTFHNIDKFSTASLVTRMTTDVIECADGIYDDYPYCHPCTVNAGILHCHGNLYGRKAFACLCCCGTVSDDRTDSDCGQCDAFV